MQIQVNTNYKPIADGVLYKAGNVYEVSEDVGKELLSSKCGVEIKVKAKAEKPVEVPAEEKKPKKKKSKSNKDK